LRWLLFTLQRSICPLDMALILRGLPEWRVSLLRDVDGIYGSRGGAIWGSLAVWPRARRQCRGEPENRCLAFGWPSWALPDCLRLPWRPRQAFAFVCWMKVCRVPLMFPRRAFYLRFRSSIAYCVRCPLWEPSSFCFPSFSWCVAGWARSFLPPPLKLLKPTRYKLKGLTKLLKNIRSIRLSLGVRSFARHTSEPQLRALPLA
jgi:hypothetical protein